MELFRTLRIALLIACIFAAGIATGRYSMPPAPAGSAAQFSSTSGRVITPRALILFFDQKLSLTPAQKQRLLPEAQQFVREIADTEPATRERFDIFHRYYPRVRALLRQDQYTAFDGIVKAHTEAMNRILEEAK
jgi:hypothetical protein